MLALLVGIAIQQQTDPVARFATFLAECKSFTIEYTVKDTRARDTATCKYEAVKPNMEKFSSKWGGEIFTYTHSPKGGISVRNDLKAYAESYAVPVYGYLPDTMSGVSVLAYPYFLFPPTLKDIYQGGQVKAAGQETVRGNACDKVVISSPGGNNSTFWIGKDGRVWRWSRVTIDNSGSSTTLFEITKFESSAPTTANYYASNLPLGYVPYQIPLPKTRTLQTEDKAAFGQWYDARLDKKTDASKLPRPLAIVFTDPTCAICAKIEPYLAGLRRQLKAKGCALIEVSLGSKRPNTATKDKDRPVFWDSDGAIERAYGTPGTPYFLVVDKSGTLVAGFQGYTKELEPTITKSLLVPFEPDQLSR